MYFKYLFKFRFQIVKHIVILLSFINFNEHKQLILQLWEQSKMCI